MIRNVSVGICGGVQRVLTGRAYSAYYDAAPTTALTCAQGAGPLGLPVPRRSRESDTLPCLRGKAAPWGAWRRGGGDGGGEASAAPVGRKLGAQQTPNFAGSLPSGVRPPERLSPAACALPGAPLPTPAGSGRTARGGGQIFLLGKQDHQGGAQGPRGKRGEGPAE